MLIVQHISAGASNSCRPIPAVSLPEKPSSRSDAVFRGGAARMPHHREGSAMAKDISQSTLDAVRRPTRAVSLRRAKVPDRHAVVYVLP